MDTPTIHIKAFGMVAEKIGSSELSLEKDASDTRQILEWLFSRYPELNEVKFAIAVDRKIAHDNTPVFPHSEIALLPPFSGG